MSDRALHLCLAQRPLPAGRYLQRQLHQPHDKCQPGDDREEPDHIRNEGRIRGGWLHSGHSSSGKGRMRKIIPMTPPSSTAA